MRSSRDSQWSEQRQASALPALVAPQAHRPVPWRTALEAAKEVHEPAAAGLQHAAAALMPTMRSTLRASGGDIGNGNECTSGPSAPVDAVDLLRWRAFQDSALGGRHAPNQPPNSAVPPCKRSAACARLHMDGVLDAHDEQIDPGVAVLEAIEQEIAQLDSLMDLLSEVDAEAPQPAMPLSAESNDLRTTPSEHELELSLRPPSLGCSRSVSSGGLESSVRDAGQSVHSPAPGPHASGGETLPVSDDLMCSDSGALSGSDLSHAGHEKERERALPYQSRTRRSVRCRARIARAARHIARVESDLAPEFAPPVRQLGATCCRGESKKRNTKATQLARLLSAVLADVSGDTDDGDSPGQPSPAQGLAGRPAPIAAQDVEDGVAAKRARRAPVPETPAPSGDVGNSIQPTLTGQHSQCVYGHRRSGAEVKSNIAEGRRPHIHRCSDIFRS